MLAIPLAVQSQENPPKKPDSLDVNYADQLPRIPAVKPKDALATFKLQPGFRIEQVATEPLVADPVAIAFDEFGRMYVAEMLGYSEDGGDNLGQVRLVEDTDNDGRFDKSTVFVKGLSWPTAVTCWNGGVLIGAAPDIFYCRDLDGDGVSDSKEIVFTGFRRSNVQGLLNTFKWGLDNRIHGATSSSGADVKQLRHPKAKTLPLNRRDFAIEPLTMAMSAASGGGQHGLSFDPFGQKFVCSNSDHLQVIQFEDRYVARNPYIKSLPNRISIALDGRQATVYRASPVEPWRVVRTRLRVQKLVPGPVEGGGTASGYFTGATGITIYRGNAFPPDFYGNAFVADCGSNLIHRKKLVRDQLKVVGQRQYDKGEFITSKDIWFRPVQMANAPDGTLFVCDMSREVIEHPKSLHPIIKQHLDLTSGRTQGRIYRIVPTDFKQPTDIAIGKLSNLELAKVLDHPNGWHRETAARLIYTRRAVNAAEAIETIAVSGERSEGRVRALYALAGIEQLTAKTLFAALNDNDHQVRRHAIRLAEDASLQSPAVVDRLVALAADESLPVALQLAFTLGEIRSARRVEAMAKLIQRTSEIKDPQQAELIRFAIQTSTVDIGSDLLRHLLNSSSRKLPQVQTFASALANQIAVQDDDSHKSAFMILLKRTLKNDERLGAQILQAALQASKNTTFKRELSLITTKGEGALLDSIVSAAKSKSLDQRHSVENRIQAIRTLRVGEFVSVANTLAKLIDYRQPQQIQAAALSSLAAFDDPRVVDIVVKNFNSLSPQLQDEGLETIFSRTTWIHEVLKQISEKKFDASAIGPTRVSFLMTHPNAGVRTQAKLVFKSNVLARRGEVVTAYRDALKMPSDAQRGRQVFRKTCATCHRLEEFGHQIGKDLKSIRNRGPEAILVNVLDPNREVDPAYVNYTVITTRGRTYSGIIADESATSVTLKRAENTTDTLLRINIDELKSSRQSIMPEGLEKQINKQQMADLIAYLMSLK